MFTLLFWVVVGILGLVQALISLSALRVVTAHASPGRGAWSRPMEVAWTLLPSLLLAGMALLSFDALQERDHKVDGSSAMDSPAIEEMAETSVVQPNHSRRSSP